MYFESVFCSLFFYDLVCNDYFIIGDLNQDYIVNRFLKKKPTELVMYLEKYSIRRYKYTNDLKKIMIENNFHEGANNYPGEFVLEKAFVG